MTMFVGVCSCSSVLPSRDVEEDRPKSIEGACYSGVEHTEGQACEADGELNGKATRRLHLARVDQPVMRTKKAVKSSFRWMR